MSMRTSILVMVTAVLAWAASDALAIPVLWTFSGATYNDGATLTGSFIYDADTNTYSAISVTASGGSTPTLNGAYDFVCTSPCATASPSATGAPFLTVSPSSNLTGLPVGGLQVTSAMTDGGGTRTLVTGIKFDATCSNSTCSTSGAPSRSFTAGTITGTPVAPAVPTPTLSWWGLIFLATLLGTGGVVVIYRRPT